MLRRWQKYLPFPGTNALGHPMRGKGGGGGQLGEGRVCGWRKAGEGQQ